MKKVRLKLTEFIKKNLLFIIVSLFILVSITMITGKIIPIYDDIVYHFEHGAVMMQPDYSKPIESFSQIIYNQSREYMMHNSRTLVNLLIQSIILVDFGLYKFFNAVFMLIIVLATTRIVTGKFNDAKMEIIVFSLCMLFSYMIKQQAYYWFTGAVHYLWIEALSIMYIVPFIDILMNRDMDCWSNKGIQFFWSILAFIVGWGSHITNLVIWGVVIFTFVFCKINNRKMDKFLLTSLIPLAVGTFILWIAPSNWIRGEGMLPVGDLISMLKESFSMVFEVNFLMDFNIQFIFWMLSIYYVWQYSKKFSLASLIIALPLLFILITRNQFIYVEVAEPLISLIYPRLILSPPDYYHNVSWNLQYYFYGFYMIYIVILYTYLLIKDPKRNFVIWLLAAAAFSGNLTRLIMPAGSERTAYFSDAIYVLVIGITLYRSVKSKKAYKYCAIAASVLAFALCVKDYNIYSKDYEIYQVRREKIEACLATNCKEVTIPRYTVKGYYVGPGAVSPHTNYVRRVLELDEIYEYNYNFDESK